eukprot:CFRG0602T1
MSGSSLDAYVQTSQTSIESTEKMSSMLSDTWVCPDIPDRTKDILAHIRESLVGKGTLINGPFGPRLLTYCDYVASGRSLTFIEEYINKQVLPMYANTHTESSATGYWAGSLREQARETIAQACGIKNDSHAVIFTGTGSTAAIDSFQRMLFQGVNKSKCGQPVVIIGPYEHHSNILPWRESEAKVVVCHQSEDGGVDMVHAEKLLKKYCTNNRPFVLGTFSAASNINGRLINPKPLTKLFHLYGALISFDYAAAAPYTKVDVADSRADALFISTHKFVGGPCTPGVLVVRKSIIENNIPHRPAGGTVLLVTDNLHVYLDNIIEREEGGTPDIVGSIRAGMVFSLKEAVGPQHIQAIETSMLKYVYERMEGFKNFCILGDRKSPCLGTISFVVNYDKLFLHHNFVAAVLNDLFGIQARGGCACAGPYGLKLLGMHEGASKLILNQLIETKQNILKPGFTRLNLSFFADAVEIDYLVAVMQWIACNCWRLLPLYSMDIMTGLYTFKPRAGEMHGKTRPTIPTYDFSNSKVDFSVSTLPTADMSDLKSLYSSYLRTADQVARSVSVPMPEDDEFIDNVDQDMIFFLRRQHIRTAMLDGLDFMEMPPHSLMNPEVMRQFSKGAAQWYLKKSRAKATSKASIERIRVINQKEFMRLEPSLHKHWF